jgi:hypothetical protein
MKSTGEAIRFIKDLNDPHFRQLSKEKSMFLSRSLAHIPFASSYLYFIGVCANI